MWLTVGVGVLATALIAQAPAAAVVCTSVGIDPIRTWRLVPIDGGWRVVHRAGNGRDVMVALPRTTEVRLTSSQVHVKGRTSNGGIDITLSGPAARATLDLYVSYELEVNVDASLTPAIDELNTEGPVGVRCDVTKETP